MIALLRALSLAPLRARARRSVLAILAIAVGVALGLAVNLVNDAALAEMQQAFRTLSGEADVRIEGVNRTIDESLYGTIGQRNGIESIAPIIELEVAVAGRRELLKVIGLDPFASARFTPQLLTRPEDKAQDPLAQFGSTRIAVSPAVLTGLQDGHQPATQLTLATPNGPRNLEISGVLAGIESRQRVAVLDIAVAQNLFNMQGQITRLDLRLMPGVDRAAFISDITSTLPLGAHAVAPEVHEQQSATMSRAYRVNLTMLAMIALFSGALLVFSTQMLSVAERISELAFLRVIGVTARGTVGLMLFEAVLLGAAGALLGAALGYALAWGALQVLGGDLGAGFFYGTRPTLTFAPWTTLAFVILGGGSAVLGALIPALAAARAHPAQALKSGALQDTANAGPPPVLGGVLLAVSALLAFAPAIHGLPVLGYIAISGMLIGAILLTPAISGWVFRSAERCTQTLQAAPTIRLAVTRLANAPAQAGISLAAVLAAVSLAGAMAIMVTSFRHSVEDWLEQVLPAPAYLRQTTPGQAKSQGYFDAAAQAVIRATPGVMRAEFVRFEALTLDPARPPVVLLIREFGASTADQPDKRLPLVKRYTAATDAAPLVWVSESFLDLYREHLHLERDGTFDLPLPMNPNGVAAVRVRMAGIWRDYARQHGSLVINFADYARITGDRRTHDAALWMRQGISAAALLTALKSRLPGIDALDIAETADMRALSLKIFDRTFAVTYALEAVAVVIGLAGMVAAFMGLIVARKKEFGMLRHLGLTRRELTRMLTLEGTALAALGALLGLALGVILAAILVFVINPQSFGWSMDFHVPALQLAGFSATLMVAAAGSAWLTARHVLGTQDLVRSVREDW